MGLIYIIKCRVSDKCYIGQTTQPIERRWYEHKQATQRYIAYIDTDPEKIKSIRFSYLYRAMATHSIDNFYMEELVEAPDEELNDLEVEFIAKYNTIAPNGYNLASGGGSFKHSPETIELMRQQKRANLVRNPILEGMPPLVSYRKSSEGVNEAIRVVNHPLCKSRTFTVKEYGSLENAKAATCKFIKELEASGVPYVSPRAPRVQRKPKPAASKKSAKPKPAIPAALEYPTHESHKGIIETKVGFRVQKQYKDIKYFKNFEDQKFTREENKDAAINWLIQEIDKIRLREKITQPDNAKADGKCEEITQP